MKKFFGSKILLSVVMTATLYAGGDNFSPRLVGMVNGGTFRNRQATKLGDIINSSPQYASDENFFYPDGLEAVSYSSFVSSKDIF